MKILLVEDEAALCKLMARGLRKKGYAVDTAEDGEQALESIAINQYDCVVLDLNLPGLDGLEVLRRIRLEHACLRVLIVSARAAVSQRVQGLDEGANDYLTKPFDFDELDARLRALLRREFIQQDTRLAAGGLCVDTARRMAFAHGKPLQLTAKEYGILEYLMRNRGRIVSSETLMEHVWDSEADLFSNVLKYHIHALKKKIAAALGAQGPIENVRGQGYILRGEESA